jgi:hypothetical protein
MHGSYSRSRRHAPLESERRENVTGRKGFEPEEDVPGVRRFAPFQDCDFQGSNLIVALSLLTSVRRRKRAGRDLNRGRSKLLPASNPSVRFTHRLAIARRFVVSENLRFSG